MRKRTTAKGAGRTSGAHLSLTIGPNVYEYWLDALGEAFDTSGKLLDDPCDEDDRDRGINEALLHTHAAEDHASLLLSIAWESARKSKTYERDRYYAGLSEREIATLDAVSDV